MSAAELLDDWTDYVRQSIRHVIESFGPRPPGSEGETKAQEWIRDQLQAWADGPVQLEPFPVAQKAFMSMPLVAGLFFLAATVGTWISPWLAAGFSVMGSLVFLFEFVLYKQFLDPFFAKRTSCNVVGVQKPSGPVTRRLVLNGHTDAAYQWRFLHRFPKIFPWLICYSMASLAAILSIDLVLLLLSLLAPGSLASVRIVLTVVRFAFLPGVFIGVFFTSFRHVSPGANDNLSAVFLATGLARHLRGMGVRLENTELVYLITGSEEAGLRGAKAYMKRHPDEWRDVETILITLETIHDLPHMHVYNRDRNGLVRHDPRVCQLLHDAGRRCGLELGYASLFLGSSDAAAFTEAGVASGVLAAMDPRPADYYHNLRDDWDNTNPECLRKACEVILEAVRNYDCHGLADSSPPADANQVAGSRGRV